MDKETRNKLRNTVVQCRKLLEEDILGQLEGTFGIHRNGRIEPEDALPNLDAAGLDARRRAIAGVEHIQGYGMKPADAVDQFQREVAFTHLNRLCAFKMLERRGLLEETVSRGTNSNGFKVYLAAHPEDERLWQTGREYEAYKRFLFDVCARLSIEIRVLFDTEHVSSHLFPGQRALNGVLDLINAKELADIWDSDETIGWIYQYFTPKELREKARKESSAPRNSYELAFRNQFYTPRYVVQFLTDNTLGRIWYEMRKGETRLVDDCQYMVRRKRPVFMPPGEKEPDPYRASDGWADPDGSGVMWVRPNPDAEGVGDILRYALTVDGYAYAKEHLGVECGDLANERLSRYHETEKWEGTFEELRCCLFFEQRRYHHFGRGPEGEEADAIKALHGAICDRWNLETEYIPDREKKLPWEIRMLDPASGSGHFLLYAFDLLETIYDEAYDDPELGEAVRKRYPDRDAYRVAVPALILRHNLHGIDIDLRSVQIASLALWMRAQRSYQRLGVNGDGRPRIEKANIVCAEPMPGDEALLEEFCDSLSPSVLGDLVREVWQKMQLAGEAGSLLKIEEEIRNILRRAQEEWRKAPKGYKISLFDGTVHRPAEQVEFDFSDLTGGEFWEKAEERLWSSLEAFAERAADDREYSRRLFAEDAKEGFGFIDLCRHRYDVVLMNPPFGETAPGSKEYIFMSYPTSKYDLAATFAERAGEFLAAEGMLGQLASRSIFFGQMLEGWRHSLVTGAGTLTLFADLGLGVLDGAMVEAVAMTLDTNLPSTQACFLKAPAGRGDLDILVEACRSGRSVDNCYVRSATELREIPGFPFAYWTSASWRKAFVSMEPLSTYGILVRQGMESSDNFRFVRTWWEVPPGDSGWRPYAKGGGFGPQWHDIDVVVNWGVDGAEVKAFSASKFGTWTKQITNSHLYGRVGLTYPASRVEFSPRVLPPGNVVGCKGPIICYESEEVSEQEILALLAILSSSAFRALLNLTTTSGDFSRKSYREGAVLEMPVPNPRHIDADTISVARGLVQLLRQIESSEETCHYFLTPRRAEIVSGLADSIRAERRLLDERISIFYGFSGPDYLAALQTNFDDCVALANSARTALVQYLFGCVLGRWDVRMELNKQFHPPLPGVIDPLPVCPPGMLLAPDGLPARPGVIVSEGWLRARPDAVNLPPKGVVEELTISDDEYPLRVDWDGILVDDPDHPDDVVRRVRDVLELLWGEQAPAMEEEACQTLDVQSLREYLRNPKHFWEDHVKRYSKSQRKAPIYWLLQSPNRHYALWLYYHRLDKDILFKALRNYVDPKCRLEESRLKELRSPLASTAEGRERKTLEKEIDDQEDVLNDVLDFKERLEKVANLGLEPDLDDGVVLNIAPLWELVPWKEPKQYWDELVAGKYEWSSIGKQLRQKGLVRGQGK